MTKRKFLWLVSKHYDLLVKRACRVRGGGLARDSVHNAITKVLSKLSYRSVEGSNSELLSWLTSVALNETRSNIRKEGLPVESQHNNNLTEFNGKRTILQSSDDGDIAMSKPVFPGTDTIEIDVKRVMSMLDPLTQGLVYSICLEG